MSTEDFQALILGKLQGANVGLVLLFCQIRVRHLSGKVTNGKEDVQEIQFRGKIHEIKTEQQTQSFPVQESSFAWCLNYL